MRQPSRVANWHFSMPDLINLAFFENDLALKILKFSYCLAFFFKNSYLLLGIRNFEKLF